MISLMKIYAVEIMSVTMGLWLLWVTIIYSRYIYSLRTKNTKQSLDSKSEDALQEARNLRKRTYMIAVTFPSYFIFWVVVIIWGISYITETS